MSGVIILQYEIGLVNSYLRLPFLALLKAIAIACLLGLPARISVRMLREITLRDLPLFMAITLVF